MKKIFWLIIPVIAFTIWTLYSDDNDNSYKKSVEKVIETRKSFLKTSSESPFIQHNATYKEPAYFPIDKKYRVNAKVERIENKRVVNIRDNKGAVSRYQQYAWLHFNIDSYPQKLLVLKPQGFGVLDVLFCAFADGTSAGETYGAGRYLDVEIGKSNKVVLDFNLAYNPYCAYIDSYSCPLPPKVNVLPVAILAGERYSME